MRLGNGFTKQILLLILLPLLAQCGGKGGRSQDTSASAIPEQPIVITADLKVGDITYQAPWFRFKVSMSNSSDLPLYVIALKVDVTFPLTGETRSYTFSPSEANYTFTDASNVTTKCEYDNYGLLAPGTQDYTLKVNNGVTNCGVAEIWFIPSGLPVDPNLQRFTYRVKITPLGWFVESPTKSERYIYSSSFTTQ